MKTIDVDTLKTAISFNWKNDFECNDVLKLIDSLLEITKGFDRYISKTRGCIIRESNENLAKCISDMDCSFCNLDEADILEYLDQPAECEYDA